MLVSYLYLLCLAKQYSSNDEQIVKERFELSQHGLEGHCTILYATPLYECGKLTGCRTLSFLLLYIQKSASRRSRKELSARSSESKDPMVCASAIHSSYMPTKIRSVYS